MKDVGASSDVDIYMMDRSPLELSANVGGIPLDGDRNVVVMEKFGCGDKVFRKWFKEGVNYRGEDLKHPSTVYWQSQYKKWRVYDFFCDPKKLAAHDLMETLLMCLSFYLRNQNLLDIFHKNTVYFGPFSLDNIGAYSLSYFELAYSFGHLGNKQDRQLERNWCQYAMDVANAEYVRELANLGYANGKPVDAKIFGEEIMLYISKLRSGMNRNNIAHVFSTSVKQVWMKTLTKAKNRCLLDQPDSAMDEGYKKKLVEVLGDLSNDMPEDLGALGNVIPMQAHFLRVILQKPVVDNNIMPKPSKLPRAHPPMCKQ